MRLRSVLAPAVVSAVLATACRGGTSSAPRATAPPSALPEGDWPPLAFALALPPGDPLPKGATARLGTMRFRSTFGPYVDQFDLVGHDRLLVSGGPLTETWTASTGVKTSSPKREGKTVASDDGGGVVLTETRLERWDWNKGKVVAGLPLSKDDGDPSSAVLRTSRDQRIVVFLTIAEREGCAMVFSDLARVGKVCAKGRSPAPTHGQFALSGNGRVLAFVDGDGDARAARLVELPSRKELGLHGSDVRALAVSADGSRLAYTAKRTLHVVDVATGKEVLSSADERIGDFDELTFSSDGGRLAGAGAGRVAVIDAATKGTLFRARDLAHVTALSLSPAGDQVAWYANGAIRVVDVASGRAAGSDAPFGIQAAALSRDGARAALVWPGGVTVYDVASGLEKRRHVGEAYAAAFLGDDTTLVFAMAEGLFSSNAEGAVKKLSSTSFYRLALAPDGRSLVAWLTTPNGVASADMLAVLDVATMQARWTLPAPVEGPYVGRVTFGQDKNTLVLHRGDRLERFDLSTGKKLGTVALADVPYYRECPSSFSDGATIELAPSVIDWTGKVVGAAPCALSSTFDGASMLLLDAAHVLSVRQRTPSTSAAKPLATIEDVRFGAIEHHRALTCGDHACLAWPAP